MSKVNKESIPFNDEQLANAAKVMESTPKKGRGRKAKAQTEIPKLSIVKETTKAQKSPTKILEDKKDSLQSKVEADGTSKKGRGRMNKAVLDESLNPPHGPKYKMTPNVDDKGDVVSPKMTRTRKNKISVENVQRKEYEKVKLLKIETPEKSEAEEPQPKRKRTKNPIDSKNKEEVIKIPNEKGKVVTKGAHEETEEEKPQLKRSRTRKPIESKTKEGVIKIRNEKAEMVTKETHEKTEEEEPPIKRARTRKPIEIKNTEEKEIQIQIVTRSRRNRK